MRFTLKPRGVEQVVTSAGVTAELMRLGEMVVNKVEQQAGTFKQTGDFADSIKKSRPERTTRGQSITIYSDDFAAHIIEFGSANNPAYAPLRKAASSLGLRLHGGGERK